jgi:hypothetical protein
MFARAAQLCVSLRSWVKEGVRRGDHEVVANRCCSESASQGWWQSAVDERGGSGLDPAKCVFIDNVYS